MSKTICPVCNQDITVESIHLFSQVRCPKCNALLKVIEEYPLELEEVFEEEDGDEEDDGDKESGFERALNQYERRKR